MNILGGYALQKKKEGYLPLHEIYNYSTLSTQNYGSKNSTKLKFPVIMRINPPKPRKVLYDRNIT